MKPSTSEQHARALMQQLADLAEEIADLLHTVDRLLELGEQEQ